jgi:hypothetical protein
MIFVCKASIKISKTGRQIQYMKIFSAIFSLIKITFLLIASSLTWLIFSRKANYEEQERDNFI